MIINMIRPMISSMIRPMVDGDKYGNSWIFSFNSPVNCAGVIYCDQIIGCK